MMFLKKSTAPPDSCAAPAKSAPLPVIEAEIFRLFPGCNRLPTTNPMPNAKVVITRKYPNASPPILPTVAALRTAPTPRTIVQKITGPIIILIRLTNIVPRTPTALPTCGATRPTTTPAITAAMTPT